MPVYFADALLKTDRASSTSLSENLSRDGISDLAAATEEGFRLARATTYDSGRNSEGKQEGE